MAAADRAPIVVAGASGLIGTRLCAALERRGRPLVRISRIPRGPGWARWEDLPRVVAGAAAVVNLAGEALAGRRWTARLRRDIRDSRVRSAAAVAAAQPALWLQASAVGFYGERGDELLTEASAPGDGFLAEVCRAWEEPCAAYAAGAPAARCALMRFGVVLAPEGGALGKMLPIFRRGLGGRLGDGRAWMPWIHAEDAVGMLLAALEGEAWRGAVNVTAPTPARNADFTRALARTLHRPAFLPVPAWALRAAFGAGGTLLLASQRATPAAAQRMGFQFRHPELAPALADLLARPPVEA